MGSDVIYVFDPINENKSVQKGFYEASRQFT